MIGFQLLNFIQLGEGIGKSLSVKIFKIEESVRFADGKILHIQALLFFWHPENDAFIFSRNRK